MSKRILDIILLLIPLAILSSCGHSDEPAPAPLPPAAVGRTVLVYMVADNNLGNSYNERDFDEMKRGAADGGLNGGRLIVYHNRPRTNFGQAPLLLEITEQGVDTLKTYPDDPSVYSVEVSRMREVIADTKEIAPADDYGMVFWGHATSWLSHGDYDIDTQDASRSYGTDRNQWISVSGLGKALEGEHFSFLYFDCCLMGTVEIAYEFRHAAPFIVASPTELPAEGMPYHLNVPKFFAGGNPPVVEMAQNTFNYYEGMGSSYSCQMVVIDTSALDALADATRAIFATQTTIPSTLSSVQRLSGSQSKYVPTSKNRCSLCCPVYDMDHYMELLTTAGSESEDTPEILAAWREALDKTVVYKATTVKDVFNNILIHRYCGLGSYVVRLTDHGDLHGYKNTEWWNDVVSVAPVFN